ncbi:STM3941 family protein [Ornithinibacillus halotolerans]|uniref:PH domain-containing protein n=1 Tax=Ornithinibacillus halotolerans TaxID=1274357 RepID=A0A916S4R9_9BACI|nr:STM3941 family protein [Ornithinibacillus halotolerans]GGA81429.1 hypothetical protein GCM10008025_25930 [Ornithinibacillus halotolerans]
MNEIVIYAKKGKLVLYGILCILFVLVSGLLLVVGLGDSSNDRWKLIIIGGIGFIFFGLCMIYWIKSMLKRKPAIILNNEGIIDQSTYIGAGLVKWSEIADVDFVNFGGQTYLGIYTIDPELIINRSTPFKRFLNQMNKGLLATQVNIPIKILDCSLDELIDAIGYFWKKDYEKDNLN